MGQYRTVPEETTRMPKGIPYIIGNELAERFSFYGMRGILTAFMTKHLLDSAGQPDYMSDEQAKTYFHMFVAFAYFTPILGSLLADIVLGKYKTILLISLMYCLGHGMLALMDLGPITGLWDMKWFLLAGCFLIGLGAGGIKPCVSANVGDQFGTKNKHLISKTFSWFYFSINVGAATSSMLTPVLLDKVGPWLAFGVPGVLMGIATFIFWMGRHKFVHVPPGGWKKFKEETFSRDGLQALKYLIPLFLIFIPMFWAIFDQTGSAWVLQAERMDRDFAGLYWLESQIQAVNPVYILILIPFFAYVVYPTINKFVKVTPLRKIGAGLFLTGAACAISAWIEMRIEQTAPEVAGQVWALLGTTGDASFNGLVDALKQVAAAVERGEVDKSVAEAGIRAALDPMPNIGWQFVAYAVLTAAEVLVSITSLEFAYTQAPKKMKSFIMGIYFLGVSLGNFFTAGVNKFIEIPAKIDPVTKEVISPAASKLEGADYYWFFGALVTGVAVIYIVFAMMYKGRTYIQGEDETSAEAQAEGTLEQ